MSQDLLIPFLPRVVQNKLERPRLNVKRVNKEPKISDEAYKEETQQEHYEQNNVVISRRQNRHSSQHQQTGKQETILDEKANTDELTESEMEPSQIDSEGKETEALTPEQQQQLVAQQQAFEHPVYEKEEILNHEQQKERQLSEDVEKTNSHNQDKLDIEDAQDKHIDLLI
ncbi:hypothetical protein N7931_15155 [Catenovulum sp. 2E275]|uniref:hypothetical protein n=1 Tax=Catenovulum sp. 2E275 TaxID=2980497 RepID=UPI0021CFDB02|nr:hypothetical protein [Catenovulum sp. 2E275]MCU4676970.1 hypothetical protein [Catenovulum sp. 2E275]